MALAAQCGAAAAPEVIEKIVTAEVEKEVEKVVEKEIEVEKVVTVEVEKEVQVGGPNSADTAVEAAKELCGGVELNVTWEAGLQSQDPLTMGPLWEDLTGSKINVVELSYVDIYAKQMQDHLTGGGTYDVTRFTPGWLIDFAAAGVVATGVFCFIFSWTEFFFAVCLTRKDALPLSVYLPFFFGKNVAQWGRIGAVSILAMLPLFLMSFIVQRYLVRGLTLGAIK